MEWDRASSTTSNYGCRCGAWPPKRRVIPEVEFKAEHDFNLFPNAKIVFQPSFILMTFHFLSVASVINASLKFPMWDFAPYSNSRVLSCGAAEIFVRMNSVNN